VGEEEEEGQVARSFKNGRECKTSEPPSSFLPFFISSLFFPREVGYPGTWGMDDRGLIIEAFPGKKVLVSGIDVILELHRITERTRNLKAAMAACPCLAKPATCHPVLNNGR
jgi:hypothetical protein